MNKCHWCDKECGDDNYCSNRCLVEHDARFERWWKQFGLKKDEKSIDWMLEHIEFIKGGYRITNLGELE